jgi:phosphate butyryltransferase
MYTSFKQIEEAVIARGGKKRLALAASADDVTLQSVVEAQHKGIIEAQLIGDKDKTVGILKELGEDPDQYLIIDEPDPVKAIHIACGRIKDGDADMPMKGLMQSADYLRAILDKNYGFIPEKGILTEATVFEYGGRLITATDCAVVISPDYSEKVKILNNAVSFCHELGFESPKVAVIGPVETVNSKIQSTVDAAMLTMANRRGQIKGCLVDGPLALDNAISASAAKHKGIVSDVAGYADILLLPDLNSGNLMLKAIIYMMNTVSSCNMVGANIPVVMTSRSDNPENKYNSILTAVVRLK